MKFLTHLFFQKLLSRALLAIAALIIITSPSQADDKKAVILDVDYESLEENGLIDTSHPEYLSKDLFDNHKRSLITYLLETIQSPGQSVITQKLYRGVLLGGYRTDRIENDLGDSIPNGKDFLTLRIKALLRAGYFKDALALYTATGSPPYHPDLAEAGISAMVLTHQTSLACIEYKTLSERSFTGEFWDQLKTLCGSIFKDEAKAEQTEDDNQNIQPSFIKTYLKSHSQKQAYRLYGLDRNKDIIAEELLIDAISYGIWDQKKLRSYYKLHEKASLYKAINSAEGNDSKWALLQDEILSKPAELMTAYVPLLLDLEPELGSPSILKKVIDIFYHAHEDIPNFVQDAINDIDLETDRSVQALQLKLVGLILDKKHKLEAADFHNFAKENGLENNNQKKYYNNIMKKLDIPHGNLHNPTQAYEKDLRLTSMGNYVMPYRYVWDRLLESSKGRQNGETVLLSIAMLRQSSVDNLYPALFSDIRNALLEAGYRKHFSDFVLEALLLES